MAGNTQGGPVYPSPGTPPTHAGNILRETPRQSPARTPGLTGDMSVDLPAPSALEDRRVDQQYVKNRNGYVVADVSVGRRSWTVAPPSLMTLSPERYGVATVFTARTSSQVFKSSLEVICSTFSRRALSSDVFGYLRGSWNQSPAETEGQLYVCIESDTAVSHA